MPAYLGINGQWKLIGAAPSTPTPPNPTPTGGASNWTPFSATNLPWANLSESAYTALWPTAVRIVDLDTSSSSDFYTLVQSTMNAVGTKAVIRLPSSPTTGGVFHLNQFRMIGSSGDPLYAKGLYHSNLLGFIGKGPSNTFIQMDARSTMPAGAISKMSTLTTASNYELQLGMMRLDGTSAANPISLAGLTFRGADQEPLNSVYSDVPAYTPQPAPYSGVAFYAGSYFQMNHCRFQASAHAWTSRGPFELGNFKSQKCSGTVQNVESDGRLSAAINSAQPRRSTVIMVNDENSNTLTDFWGHHTNVSRYAANDQQQTFGVNGKYTTTRAQFDHIADLQNTDPAQNNGQTLDGYSDPCCMGWESSSATITLNQPYLEQDNSHMTKNQPLHISLTVTNGDYAGKIYIYGGTFRNFGHPIADGYLSMKISSGINWYKLGLVNTVFAYNDAGVRKTPILTTNWPPTTAQLTNTSPDTHYFVKTT